MKIVSLLAAAIVSCSIAAPAYAFHPADETYGYVPPKKFDRKHRVTAQQDSQPLFGMSWDWDRPQKERADNNDDREQPDGKNLPNLTGGGQPQQWRRLRCHSRTITETARSSSIRPVDGSTTCSLRRPHTAIRLRSASRASPGPGRRRSRGRSHGPTGSRRRRCEHGSLAFPCGCRAASATRSAPWHFISAIRSIASTARTKPLRSARLRHRGAFA